MNPLVPNGDMGRFAARGFLTSIKDASGNRSDISVSEANHLLA